MGLLLLGLTRTVVLGGQEAVLVLNLRAADIVALRGRIEIVKSHGIECGA